MTSWEIWLLAVGLAMDCFAVSIASGIVLRRVQWRAMLVMSLSFGIFQALMPLIGWAAASLFSHLIEEIDHWVAFGILGFLGVRMIREGLKEEECRESFDPTRLFVVFTFAVATSIDALAVGVSFAFVGMEGIGGILPAVSSIGWVSFLMSLIGLYFGIRCGCGLARRLKAELLGGIILVLIGCKILVEHLFFHS